MSLMTSPWQKWLLRWVAALAVATLAACGSSGNDDNDGSGDDTGFTIDTEANTAAAAIAQESDADYDNNVNGLITGTTLQSWISDWSANKPSGVTGNLVILQTSAGETGSEYVAHDDTNVFTYDVGAEEDEWDESRSNGVIETIRIVPSGATMDTFLAKYDIDPSADMIVCAQGTAGAGSAMRAGRCWYMFRYWGTPKEHLAVLDGGNEWNATNNGLSVVSSGYSTPPGNGTASVKDLTESNFALQATLEDMMAAVPETDADDRSDGVFLWDARSSGEYSPTDDTTFKNSGATQGHPNGALLLSYDALLNTDAGYTYKTKSEIQGYLDGTTNGFVDSTLSYVGAGGAYQDGDTIYTYCETTYRAMVTGIASGVILGLPTRFYDGAMYEWHSMANVTASDGTAILPADSPWRTDQATRSMYLVASDASNVEPRTIVNADAESANAIIEADEAYKASN